MSSANIITMARVAELRRRSPKGGLDHLILSLYSMFPPLRGGEYLNMQYSKVSGANWCDLSRGLFIIGRRTLRIPRNLLEIIRAFSPHGPHLFGREMTSLALTKRLARILQVPATIDDLRRQYIAEVVPSMPIGQRKKLAFIMGYHLQIKC
jgi:hypothetical protein